MDNKVKYKKSDLTKFAKDCAYGANNLLNGMCISEEFNYGFRKDIVNEIIHHQNDDLLVDVSKRYAKYAKDQMAFDVENGKVQNFQNLVEKIVECCEENDWFLGE